MMNKQIAAVLGLALMLTACGNNDNTAPDMSVIESETITEISAENTNIEWNISLISFLSIRNMRYGVTKSSLAKEFFYMVIYCMVRAV